MMNALRSQNGFTLLELLVTITILAITLSLTAPSIESAVTQNQLNATILQLQRAVSLARTESIKRGHRVVMCLSDQLDQCNPSHPVHLLIFSDPGKKGSPTSDGDLIKVVALKFPTITASYNRSFLAFSPLGYASGTNGTFKTCHQSGEGELLVISALGRTRKAVDYDGDGLVEKYPGDPISC